MGSFTSSVKNCKPHLVMTSCYLGLALFIVLLRLGVTSGGISGTVIVVYEHVVSSVLLSTLAFFLERGKRPPFSLRILCWASFLGLLQAVLGQLFMTWSLNYITASFQSVALNAIPVVVFVLAVATQQESLQFFGIYGQAKVWGIVTSAAGATIMVLLSRDGDRSQGLGGIQFMGGLLVGVAVLSTALANLLVEYVSLKYPAQITLSALMNVSGAIQVAVVGAITERNSSSWRIRWNGSLELFIILYGGIVVTGLVFYMTNWCIQKKGPVFTMAFSPLLIFFSFLLEILIFKRVANPWSIIGAVLVISGLYFLLWSKANEQKADSTKDGESSFSNEASNVIPLLPERR